MIISGTNPMDFKKRLAHEIISFYHGNDKSVEAREYFEKVHSRKEIPDDIKTVKLEEKKWWLPKLIQELGFAKSSGEARRLIQSGGVKINDEKITDVSYELEIKGEIILKAGKRNFAKLI